MINILFHLIKYFYNNVCNLDPSKLSLSILFNKGIEHLLYSFCILKILFYEIQIRRFIYFLSFTENLTDL